MAATGKSTQLTNLALVPPTILRPAESMGIMRVISFDYTTAALTIGQYADLCVIPAGATILGGAIAHNDIGNSISIGTDDDVTKYLGQTSVASANTSLVPFAHTIALSAGQRVTAATTLVACARSGTWTAGKLLKGYVIVSID